MEIPKLGSGKAIIIKSDYSTGIILNNDGTFYNNEGDNYFKEMKSMHDALIYANDEVKKGLVEISIYDDTGEFKRIFRPEIRVKKEKVSQKGNLLIRFIKKLIRWSGQ